MWSYSSLFLYMTMAFIGYVCIKNAKKQERINGNTKLLNKYYVVLWASWVFIAIFREVGLWNGILIGGTDARGYVHYFQYSLNNGIGEGVTNIYATRAEVLYRLINQFIRRFTADYRIFFLIIYSFIIWAYIAFIKEFGKLEINYLPVYMLFFVFLKSFSVIRTHIAIAMILFAIIALKRKKNVLAILFFVASCFVQRASLAYAIFPIFYWIYQKKKITPLQGIVYSILCAGAGLVAQQMVVRGMIPFMSGLVYKSYASQSMTVGYFLNYIKMIFEQLVVVLMVVFFNKTINGKMSMGEQNEAEKMRWLQIMCYFDMMMIPLCYVMNIWRGADYFFLPRLLVLGEIIMILRNRLSESSRKLFYMIVILGIAGWFIFRLSTTYGISGLMPYRFDFK